MPKKSAKEMYIDRTPGGRERMPKGMHKMLGGRMMKDADMKKMMDGKGKPKKKK